MELQIRVQRVPTKRGQLTNVQRILLKNGSSQGHNLALTALFVPSYLDRGGCAPRVSRARQATSPAPWRPADCRAGSAACLSTRWTTKLSSKVNLPLRNSLLGANSITSTLKFRGGETFAVHRVGTGPRVSRAKQATSPAPCKILHERLNITCQDILV